MNAKRTEDEVIAGIIVGERLEGNEPTAETIAAARRAFRGETTAEEESSRVIAEIIARRTSR